MWDNVPWFVGGGAFHSPEVARLLAYASTSGAEGIVAAGDLKVVPLAVPGTSVRSLAGACLILNRAASGDQQTYVGRSPSETVKAIAATGSGGGRNDLVIAQIKDPFLPGEPWADPADVTVGPYIFTEIVPNVPLSATVSTAAASAHLRTLGITGIPLAAIVMAANTATITTNEIKDLRQLALPREKRVPMLLAPPVEDSLTTTAWRSWPNWTPTIDVPSWAVRAIVEGRLYSVGHRFGATAGALAVQLGSLQSSEVPYDLTSVGGDGERITLAAFGDFDVPSSMRGTTQVLKIAGRRDTGEVGNLVTVAGTQLVFDVTFYERPV